MPLTFNLGLEWAARNVDACILDTDKVITWGGRAVAELITLINLWKKTLVS